MWHIPSVFMLGLRSQMWHGIEQASFLATGLLFWWPVVRPLQNSLKWPESSILLYLFLATLPCDILSGFLVFCDRVVYPVFLSSPRSFGLSALEDQQCAGALMWTCVTVVYLIAGAVFTARLLSPHQIGRARDSAIRLATHCGTAHGSAQDGGGLKCHTAPHLPSFHPLQCKSAVCGGSTLLSDYWALTKPEVNFLILITTFVGFYLASANEWAAFSFAGLFNTLLGTLLVASGTGTLNQYLERKFDAQMRRTARRPAAAGRLTPSAVLAFGIALAVAGSIYLAIAVNLLASVLATLTLLTYLFVYTPLKRKTPMCVLVGAFPGAMPPLIGWAAASGRLNIEAGILYAMLFSVAVSTFHGNRMDVPRRLRPRRLFGSAQGQCESSFRDFGDSIAAPCSRRYQHHAISDTARGDFLLCSGSSGNRIHVLRMEIRIRAFESCCTPAADGFDCLSSTAVRTKRDAMQSGQMIPYSNLPADSNK